MINKDICPYNENIQRHGYWVIYYSNGNLGYKGHWNNGIQVGYEETYGLDGELEAKKYYII